MTFNTSLNIFLYLVKSILLSNSLHNWQFAQYEYFTFEQIPFSCILPYNFTDYVRYSWLIWSVKILFQNLNNNCIPSTRGMVHYPLKGVSCRPHLYYWKFMFMFLWFFHVHFSVYISLLIFPNILTFCLQIMLFFLDREPHFAYVPPWNITKRKWSQSTSDAHFYNFMFTDLLSLQL